MKTHIPTQVPLTWGPFTHRLLCPLWQFRFQYLFIFFFLPRTLGDHTLTVFKSSPVFSPDLLLFKNSDLDYCTRKMTWWKANYSYKFLLNLKVLEFIWINPNHNSVFSSLFLKFFEWQNDWFISELHYFWFCLWAWFEMHHFSNLSTARLLCVHPVLSLCGENSCGSMSVSGLTSTMRRQMNDDPWLHVIALLPL